MQNHFFRKDGKPLKTFSKPAAITTISSLGPETTPSILNEHRKSGLIKQGIEIIRGIDFSVVLNRIPRPNTHSIFRFMSYSSAFFILLLLVFLAIPKQIVPSISKYSMYSSKPFMMDTTKYDVYTKDSRSQRINSVFGLYNCPLEGMGEMFVHEADENEIPWWIAAAISFQESSCGKNTPKIDGKESYNAWGWAVYGENVHEFDNWARGIETVSKYLSKKFYSQGITDTCDIMQIYTPPSKGSWCEGINHFKDLIVNYKTPPLQ